MKCKRVQSYIVGQCREGLMKCKRVGFFIECSMVFQRIQVRDMGL